MIGIGNMSCGGRGRVCACHSLTWANRLKKVFAYRYLRILCRGELTERAEYILTVHSKDHHHHIIRRVVCINLCNEYCRFDCPDPDEKNLQYLRASRERASEIWMNETRKKKERRERSQNNISVCCSSSSSFRSHYYYSSTKSASSISILWWFHVVLLTSVLVI